KANDTIVTLAMIETAHGLANLDEILSVEGLDGVYIGSMDLSISLGIEKHGEISHPILNEAIAKICKKTKAKGKFVGMHTKGIDEIAKLREFGINLITIYNDSRLLRRTIQSVYDNAKNLTN
ncbi:MAG: 2,4-dihydroxyhept-2-ene-1,7-dioic acid aldolase, partial [Candidatus Heimdallarchaeota archaeon]|nr:2,4-dihydroxyhept-2-ene-1,7-dioic acid aldolase [Candidatus Heimdallarchaeota archaeon]